MSRPWEGVERAGLLKGPVKIMMQPPKLVQEVSGSIPSVGERGAREERSR